MHCLAHNVRINIIGSGIYQCLADFAHANPYGHTTVSETKAAIRYKLIALLDMKAHNEIMF
jgi:hypothetical protein